ncbi:MAG: glycosyltransferase family 4 protein [Arenicellales bacterium]|nr:glycosyltransferase family 4 protein [Arenicellales bacterium]
MKILSLCLSYARGGLELYAFRSMQVFQELGYLKRVVVRPSTPMYEWVQAEGLDFDSLKTTGNWSFGSARSLAGILDREQIDIIHINWGNDLKLAVLAKRFSKRKPALVYSRHMRIPGSKQDPYHRWIYRQVDRLIVTTKEMYDQATTNLPITRDRVSQLYLGIRPPEAVGCNRCTEFFEELDLSQDRFSIGLFGRIEHTKGQHILVDAVRHLVNSGCDVQAVIIGQAMEPTYQHGIEQRIADNDLRDRIRVHDFMADANRLMRCFDVVVLPSYSEHFGLVLIEAMYTGVAVVGTAAGGAPEIIHDGVTGLLCEPGNASHLADKIRHLYDDQSMRESLAKAGQDRAQELFSEARHFEALFHYFEQAIVDR